MKKNLLALATATAIFVAGAANAATLQLNLVSSISESANGQGTALFTGTTATWSYDTLSTQVTGSGLYVELSQTTPAQPGNLFTRSINDLVTGGNGAASATSFSCSDGSLSFAFGASFCGNYTWGTNFANESSVTYGPGTAASRIIGGDDVISGAMQTIGDFDGMSTTVTATQVILSNAVAGVSGQTMTFDIVAVPVPAAVWLFGSALGMLGWIRRRATS